jgi:predicted transcriptional regulator
MVRKARNKENSLLTEVELELMNILWKLDEGTVNHVLKELKPDRKLAYTSASTILRILEQKKLVKSRKEGRAHIYTPILDKSSYETISLNHLIENVFNNNPSSMITRLINTKKLSDAEIEKIANILNENIEK